MRKLLFIAVAITSIFVACRKTEFDRTVTGEALGTFRLQSPSPGTNLVLNAATPNQQVEISWTGARPGLATLPTYRWVATMGDNMNFEAPYLSVPASDSGADTRLVLTYKQIDDLLKAKGVAEGATVTLNWTVIADNNKNSVVRSDDVFTISITRFSDGATPFVLLGPASSGTNMEINPSSTTDNFTFNWTKSVAANAGAPVRYRVYFYTDDDAMTPVFSMLSNNTGVDSLLTISYKAFSDSLSAHGYNDFGAAARLRWRVAATSGNWTQWSDYTNQISVVRLVRMYLVGSINGWDINAPLEMIADKKPDRMGKVFYTYISLAANDEFKFVREVGNWGSAYGNTGGSAGSYTTAINQGGNFTVPAAGVYRLTIDAGSNMAYVQQKQVGVVGGMQGWNPSAPIYGGLAARNKFIIILAGTNNEEFKFHDGPAWDNSTPDKARWWGKGAADGLLDNDGNGGNLVANGVPRTRAIWNGTDPQQVKYEISSASEMRVVGDGMNGVNAWDPGSSPQMTYAGNGVWTITLSLLANKDIKFVAGNAWGAFDYEDAGAGPVAGTRRLKWEGGDNFKTPATAGSYTITLNEHTQTVSIN